MLEQEIASIIKFTLDAAGNPSPYYYSVPQDFVVPAAYIPTPEITTGGETFRTYNMDYVWYIKFFAETTRAAYDLGLLALTAIRGKRNLIPLIDQQGDPAGGGLRIDDPDLKTLDDGAAQLKLSWRSRRPYDDEEVQKMVTYEVEGWRNPDLYVERRIETAVADAIANYAIDHPATKETGQYPKA